MTGNEEILARLTAASAEGLEPNLRRFLAFLGWTEGEVFELQALHVPADRNVGRWKDGMNVAAHGSTLATLERLATQADAFKAQGVYAIFNRVDPGVQHRRGPGAWHVVTKGEGTTDNDITHRRAVLLDLDPQRTKGISTTDEELAAAAARAERTYELLTRFIPAESLAEGLSGNGCALFLALEPLPAQGEGERLCKGLLIALAALLDDPAVKVDTSVSDPKRLCFLPGTVKRKGAHSTERPHRRAAFLAPEQPHRLTLDELRALVMSLRELLPEAVRADLDKELAGPPSKGAPRGQASPSATTQDRREAPHRGAAAGAAGGQACEQVNRELPVRDVLARFGLLDGDRPTCPGCRESDSGVAIVGNGLKCSHNRCAQKGYRAGFRTVVDLVVEVEGVDVPGALSYIRREFPGILPERPQAPQPAPAAPPTEPPLVQEPLPAPPFLPLATPRDLPAFPLHALPRPVATFVSQIAAALECPLDLPACLALGALGSVSMKRFTASPKPDWQEPLNLYVAIALEPGESKSPAFRQVFGPLYALQKQQGEDWKKECKRIDERNADKAKGAPDEPKPVRPRLFVDDATPEKIGMVMAEQGERITLASDEGTAFQHMCGLYSKNGQANAGIYLKAHDGGYYVVDRTVRESIHLEAPLMTVALAVQPTVIRELSKRPDLRGRGLWGRFIYAFPASRVGTRTHDGPPVDPLVRDEWRDLLTWLASPPLPSAPEVLRFSPEARRRFHQAELEIERALLPGGALSSVRDWAGKLRGLIARLAGLLHIAEEAAPGLEPIPVDTVEHAIDLARYFTAHALYTFNIEMTLDPAEQAARQAWEVIAQRGLERVTPGAIGKWVKSLRKTPDAVAALETLCRQGCLMTDPEHRGKGKAYLVRKGPTVPTNTDQYRPDTDHIPTTKDAENEQTDPQEPSRARMHGTPPPPAPPPAPPYTDPVGMVGMVGIDEKPAESERSAVGAGSVCGSVCSSDPADLPPEPTPPPASRVDTAPTANDRKASADDPPSYSVGPDGLGVIEA